MPTAQVVNGRALNVPYDEVPKQQDKVEVLRWDEHVAHVWIQNSNPDEFLRLVKAWKRATV